MEQHQPKLHYDDFDDALTDLVMGLGGFKKVGPQLWPALPAEDAAQRLRHALNKSRREKLSQHELLALLRFGKQIGCHAAKHYLDDEAGYARGVPVDPRDRVSALQREFIESVQNQERLLEELKRLAPAGLHAVAGTR